LPPLYFIPGSIPAGAYVGMVERAQQSQCREDCQERF
jgi:hypothetical protein